MKCKVTWNYAILTLNGDKRSIIPLIRAAQKYNSALTFWASPWSPPSWMKINNDYPVVSSRHNHANPNIDYLLYGSVEGIDENEMQFLGERKGKFPRRLATQDYFIQDPRYLQAYANYFCKFIDAYKEQGVNIDMIIYQNEAYSYTPYPAVPGRQREPYVSTGIIWLRHSVHVTLK